MEIKSDTDLKPDEEVLHAKSGRAMTVVGTKDGVVATFMGLIPCRYGERAGDWSYFYRMELKRILG